MGDIHVRAKIAVGAAQPRTMKMQVDGGSVTSVIGLNDACDLVPGLVSKGAKIRRETVGGSVLIGLQLNSVSVTIGKRKAVLHDVFVPVAEEITIKRTDIKTGRAVTKTARRPVDRNEPPLIGQDFLQATDSIINYATHRLEGIEFYEPVASLSRKFRQLPATEQDREVLRAMAHCRVPWRRE